MVKRNRMYVILHRIGEPSFLFKIVRKNVLALPGSSLRISFVARQNDSTNLLAPIYVL